MKLKKVKNGTETTYDIEASLDKLSGIEAGAEVNQEAFSNIKIGSTTIAADSKTDTLNIVAGSNITLTPDATNDKITIASTNTPTFTNLTTNNLTTKGEVEIYGTTQTPQPHIDFHYNNSTKDYTSRIIENSEGAIDILAPKGVLINGKQVAPLDIGLEVIYEDPKNKKYPRLTDLSYTAKYIPFLGMVFVRIYGKINYAMNVGYDYNLLKFTTHVPSFVTALAAKCSKAAGAVVKKDAKNEKIGYIALRPTVNNIDAESGYALYIAGFWFA